MSLPGDAAFNMPSTLPDNAPFIAQNNRRILSAVGFNAAGFIEMTRTGRIFSAGSVKL
jgi:hypothetical protein